MIERIIQTELTKPANLKYDHPAGTKVTKVDIYVEKGTSNQIFFSAPKVDGLYFQRAEQLFKEAEEKKKVVFASKGLVNPKDSTQGVAFIDSDAVLDFFSIASAGVVLLFSSVEAQANHLIEIVNPINYIKSKDIVLIKIGIWTMRRKKDVKLSMEEILFLGIEEKLKKVIPGIYNFESPVNEAFWESFKKLKSLRDGLTHPIQDRVYRGPSDKNSVYADLLDTNFNELLRNIKDLIDFLRSKI
ncbi:MAG: hypothetical protein NTZ18_02655 [Candidatus Komeilibacteria bacterium]|nr:hypothetical protein [Candidatus Komeilibacteria bacterium]